MNKGRLFVYRIEPIDEEYCTGTTTGVHIVTPDHSNKHYTAEETGCWVCTECGRFFIFQQDSHICPSGNIIRPYPSVLCSMCRACEN